MLTQDQIGHMAKLAQCVLDTPSESGATPADILADFVQQLIHEREELVGIMQLAILTYWEQKRKPTTKEEALDELHCTLLHILTPDFEEWVKLAELGRLVEQMGECWSLKRWPCTIDDTWCVYDFYGARLARATTARRALSEALRVEESEARQ